MFTLLVRDSLGFSEHLPGFLDSQIYLSSRSYKFLRNSLRSLEHLAGRLREVRPAGRLACATPWSIENAMQDLMMLIFTVVFFALAFLYVKGCQKLR